MEQSTGFNIEEIRVSQDKATFSNYTDVKTTHIHFDWFVNFDKSAIEGTTTLTMSAINDVQTVTLDTWALDVHKVSCHHDDHSHDLEFKVGDETEIGSPMTITLNETQKAGSTFKLVIAYATTPSAKSLSWCKPEQTVEGKHPYLYSNSEPIYGRSIFPCQDTPSVKAPYSASVKSHLKVLLSADVVEERKSEDGEFTVTDFSMTMPIPSYLVSIAVGNISFRKIGERCGVYCEESFIDKVAIEFEDMEQYLKI